MRAKKGLSMAMVQRMRLPCAGRFAASASEEVPVAAFDEASGGLTSSAPSGDQTIFISPVV
jgi:hypothetical protein